LTHRRLAALRCVVVWLCVRTTLHSIVTRGLEVGRQSAALLKLSNELTRLRIFFVEVRDAHSQRLQILKPRLGGRVVNPGRLKLGQNVVIDTYRLDAVNITWACAEPEPVQHVQDALVFVELPAFRVGSLHALSADSDGESADDQAND